MKLSNNLDEVQNSMAKWMVPDEKKQGSRIDLLRPPTTVWWLNIKNLFWFGKVSHYMAYSQRCLEENWILFSPSSSSNESPTMYVFLRRRRPSLFLTPMHRTDPCPDSTPWTGNNSRSVRDQRIAYGNYGKWTISISFLFFGKTRPPVKACHKVRVRIKIIITWI